MKKSDLTRLATRAVRSRYKNSKLFLPDEEQAHAEGFEAGYRAARAELRKILRAPRPDASTRERFWGGIVGSVWLWLRPIR